MKPKRRILKEFVIGEISTVDDPAQEGARARIMKSHALSFNAACMIDDNGKFLKLNTKPQPAVAKSFSQVLNQQPQQKETTMDLNKSLSIEKQDVIAEKLMKNNPRLSERMAKHMAMGRVFHNAGLAQVLTVNPRAINKDVREQHRELEDETDAKKAKFMSKVSAIKARDKCSNVKALQKARTEYPKTFAAYQG